MSRPSFWKGGNWQQTSLFRSPFLVGSNKHEICWGVNWSLWASPRWTKSLLGVPVAMYQRRGNAHVFWYRQNRHTEKRFFIFLKHIESWSLRNTINICRIWQVNWPINICRSFQHSDQEICATNLGFSGDVSRDPHRWVQSQKFFLALYIGLSWIRWWQIPTTDA